MAVLFLASRLGISGYPFCPRVSRKKTTQITITEKGVQYRKNELVPVLEFTPANPPIVIY
jgi:hypothetical protein